VVFFLYSLPKLVHEKFTLLKLAIWRKMHEHSLMLMDMAILLKSFNQKLKIFQQRKSEKKLMSL
jgi:hypothetical protein